MTSIIVPGVDLAPSLPSRVVTVELIDVTEGQAVAGAKIDFFLPGDLHVPADDVIVQAGKVTLTLDAQGKGRVRLPAYTDAITPSDWVIGVKKHWAPHPYYIRVPAGSTAISLADIPAVQTLPQGVVDWMITGAAVTVTSGGQWDATLGIASGILQLGLTVPPGGTAWAKGILTSADLNSLYTPGVYRASSNADVSNLPPFTGAGSVTAFVTVTNIEVSNNSYAVQEVVRYGANAERWWRVSRNTSGVWVPWARVLDSNLIELTAGMDVDDLRITVTCEVRTPTVAAQVLNLPVDLPGVFESFATSNGIIVHRYTTYGSGQAIWLRTSANVTAGTMGAWVDITASPVTPVVPGGGTAALTHIDRVSRARIRRGGRIGTDGVGVVALRFDHHLDSFRTKVLPLLKQYNLPWAQIVNPQNVGTGDDNATWTEIQDWCVDTGGEVWNHGGNHGNASSEAALDTQITTSLGLLESNLPSLAVEGWAPPGVSAGGYMGAAPFATIEQNTQTYAGKLIMEGHAFVAGYAPGQYRVLDPTILPVGAPHVTIDQASPSAMTSALNGARDRAAGVAFMLHPNYLDQAGYLTTAQLTTFFGQIAAMRDSGDIRVLSYSGLWVADVATGYRHDVTPKAQSSASVGANVAHTVTITQYRTDQHFGAVREVVVDVSTAAVGTVKIQVGDGAVTTHPVPSGVSRVSRFVTLRKDATANIPVIVTPSVAATINRVSVLAA